MFSKADCIPLNYHFILSLLNWYFLLSYSDLTGVSRKRFIFPLDPRVKPEGDREGVLVPEDDSVGMSLSKGDREGMVLSEDDRVRESLSEGDSKEKIYPCHSQAFVLALCHARA